MGIFWVHPHYIYNSMQMKRILIVSQIFCIPLTNYYNIDITLTKGFYGSLDFIKNDRIVIRKKMNKPVWKKN